jgi:hypothetical protein
LISFDCFLKDSGLLSNHNLVFFKVLLAGILPFMIILTFLLLFSFYKIIRKENGQAFIRKVVISIVSILYLIHPTVANQSFALFFCMELDNGQSWMKKDLDIKCWEGQHMKWVLYLGIPIIAFWVVGVPFSAFILLFKNRKVLD